MEQSFFQPEILYGESSLLGKWFRKYVRCFQESNWLLKQKFWVELVRGKGCISPVRMQSALEKQRQSLQAGVQLHLAEILLENYILDESQVFDFFREVGSVLLSCDTCNLYFQKKIFLPDETQYCPECNSQLTPDAPAQILVADALRVDFFSPRLLSSRDRDFFDEHNFLFLEVGEYLDKDFAHLEQEIALTIESFRYWLASIAREQSLPAPEAPLDITQKISKRISRRISARFSVKKRTGKGDDKFLNSLVPLFWGYVHNLHELFWIVHQKMFARFCLAPGLISIGKLKQGLELQYGAISSGKLMHLGDALLQKHLLNEKQVIGILEKMGESVWTCAKCQLSLLRTLKQRRALACPRCKTEMKPDSRCLQYKTLSTEFFPPIPLIPGSKHVEFSFFKARQNYRPIFKLLPEEYSTAYLALCREMPTPNQESEEVLSSTDDLSATWEEIENYAKSVNKGSADESIYDYTAAPETEEEPKNPAPTLTKFKAMDRKNSPLPLQDRQFIKTNMTVLLIICFAIIMLAAIVVTSFIAIKNGRNRPDPIAKNEPLSPGKKKVRSEVKTPLETEVEESFVLRGVVYDENAEAIPGAVVTLSDGAAIERVSCDRQGQFSFEGNKGNWSVAIKADGYRPWQGQIDLSEPDARLKVTLRRLQSEQEKPENRSRGKIVGKVNLQGQNLAGLQVFAESTEKPGQVNVSLCTKDGFSLELMPGEYQLHLEKDNYHWPSQNRVWVEAGVDVAVTIQLPLLGGVRGTATLPPGRELMQEPVLLLVNTDNQQFIERYVKLSPTGEFTAKDIDQGLYLVTLSIPGLPEIPPRKLQISPGTLTFLEFTWNMGSLEGYVEPINAERRPRLFLQKIVNSNGKDMLINTQVQDLYPDENGHFIFSDVLPGNYLLMAKVRFVQGSVKVSVREYDTSFVKLSLKNDNRLEVKVLYQGNPVPDARVVVISEPYGEISRSDSTNNQGKATLAELPAGRYRLLVQAVPHSQTPLLKNSAEISISGKSTVEVLLK